MLNSVLRSLWHQGSFPFAESMSCSTLFWYVLLWQVFSCNKSHFLWGHFKSYVLLAYLWELNMLLSLGVSGDCHQWLLRRTTEWSVSRCNPVTLSPNLFVCLHIGASCKYYTDLKDIPQWTCESFLTLRAHL